MQTQSQLRPATLDDQSGLTWLLDFEYYVHRHLDWRSPLEWLGSQPFWLMEREQRILAALACLADPPEATWVRFFAASASFSPAEPWLALFEKVRQCLQPEPLPLVAALALHEWFARLLQESGFHHQQDIVVLEWQRTERLPKPVRAHFKIRSMHLKDLSGAHQVDCAAFDPLWRVSLDTLTHSYRQSAIATVAELKGEIIGFQISTLTPSIAHLARLAVHPCAQHQGVGSALMFDLLRQIDQRQLKSLTVNTQSDNHASIALYQQVGFSLTGESFPVFVYPLQ